MRIVKRLLICAVVAGGSFGTFVVVEASIASATPTSACLQAQQNVAAVSEQLVHLEALQAHLIPPFLPLLQAEINATSTALAKDLQTESQVCPSTTPTVTTTTTVTTGGATVTLTATLTSTVTATATVTKTLTATATQTVTTTVTQSFATP